MVSSEFLCAYFSFDEVPIHPSSFTYNVLYLKCSQAWPRAKSLDFCLGPTPKFGLI